MGVKSKMKIPPTVKILPPPKKIYPPTKIKK